MLKARLNVDPGSLISKVWQTNILKHQAPVGFTAFALRACVDGLGVTGLRAVGRGFSGKVATHRFQAGRPKQFSIYTI